MGEATRKYPHTLIVFLSAVTILLSIITAVDFMGFAGFLAFIFASALFSCMIFITRSLYVFIMCVPSFIFSLIFSKFSIVPAIFGFAYVLAGLTLYFAFRKKLMRTQIIVRLSAVLAAVYIFLLVLSFVISTGGDSLKSFADVIDEQAAEAVDHYFSLISSGATDQKEEAGTETNSQFLTETDKANYILNLKAIIPAMFIMYCNLTAFFITAVFRILHNNIVTGLQYTWRKGIKDGKKRKRISKEEWRIKMSVISTVIFVAGLFFTMVLSNDTYNVIPVIVITNVLYILFPGIFMVGWYFVIGKLKALYKKNITSFVTVLFLAVIFLIFSWVLILMAIIFCGIYAIQIIEIRKLTKKIKKIFNDIYSDDDDDL